MQFDILTTAPAVEKIADEWRGLYEKSGRSLFGRYEWYDIWWRHLGASSGAKLHIVTARTPAGELRAVLPLVSRRLFGLRILSWAGSEAFDYGDALAASAEVTEAVWSFAHDHGRYDIAVMRDVCEGAVSLPVLARFMRLRRQKINYFLSLDFSSSEAWLSAQSRKLRGDTRRKAEKLQTQGLVEFHVYRSGDAVSATVIDALYTQKKDWFGAHKVKGVFARPEVKGFLLDLALDAARRGTLYLAWMNCGDAIIACHMGFIKDGILHLYHTTYDAAYGTFSPGNLLMVETIKWSIDTKLRELDFMRGEETYKGRFASGQRMLSTYVCGRTWIGKMAVGLQAHLSRKRATK